MNSLSNSNSNNADVSGLFASDNFERKISYLEHKLSWLSTFPIVLPGVAKVALGCIQLICSVAIAIILSLPALFDYRESRGIFMRCISHMAHGFGNICAGMIESIPIVGFVLYMIRDYKGSKDYEKTFDQKGKFLAYKRVFEIENKKIIENQKIDTGFALLTDYTGESLMLKV